MTLMRTHFEGTVFDNRGLARADAAAGAGHSPYRWRPLVWQVDGRAPADSLRVQPQCCVPEAFATFYNLCNLSAPAGRVRTRWRGAVRRSAAQRVLRVRTSARRTRT